MTSESIQATNFWFGMELTGQGSWTGGGGRSELSGCRVLYQALQAAVSDEASRTPERTVEMAAPACSGGSL